MLQGSWLSDDGPSASEVSSICSSMGVFFISRRSARGKTTSALAQPDQSAVRRVEAKSPEVVFDRTRKGLPCRPCIQSVTSVVTVTSFWKRFTEVVQRIVPRSSNSAPLEKCAKRAGPPQTRALNPRAPTPSRKVSSPLGQRPLQENSVVFSGDSPGASESRKEAISLPSGLKREPRSVSGFPDQTASNGTRARPKSTDPARSAGSALRHCFPRLSHRPAKFCARSADGCSPGRETQPPNAKCRAGTKHQKSFEQTIGVALCRPGRVVTIRNMFEKPPMVSARLR